MDQISFIFLMGRVNGEWECKLVKLVLYFIFYLSLVSLFIGNFNVWKL